MGGSARMPPLPLRAFAGGHPSAAAPAAASDRGRRHSGASSLSSTRDAAREAVVSWGQNTWRSIGSRRNSSTTEGTSVSRQASPRWSVSSKSPRRPPRHPRGHSAGAGSSTGASATPGHSRASTPSVVWPVDSPQASYGRLPVGGKRPPGSQVVLGTTVVQDAYYSPGQPTLGGPNSVPKSAPTIMPPAGDVGAAHPRTGFAKFFSCFVQPSYQDLLSGDDYRRFTDLTTWLSYSYDDSNEHHSSKLAVLFDAAFHGKPYSSAAAGHWRRLGFQGDDPRRDFRGGGIAALDVMVYIAHHHFDVFKRVMNEGGDYGFALGALRRHTAPVLLPAHPMRRDAVVRHRVVVVVVVHAGVVRGRVLKHARVCSWRWCQRVCGSVIRVRRCVAVRVHGCAHVHAATHLLTTTKHRVLAGSFLVSPAPLSQPSSTWYTSSSATFASCT